jgi:MFS family permease
MFAPGVPQVMTDFNTGSTLVATFLVSVYILGFAFGPLIVAPLSGYRDRVLFYNICNVLFLIRNIASAVAPNVASLVAFRFLWYLLLESPQRQSEVGFSPMSCQRKLEVELWLCGLWNRSLVLLLGQSLEVI